MYLNLAPFPAQIWRPPFRLDLAPSVSTIHGARQAVLFVGALSASFSLPLFLSCMSDTMITQMFPAATATAESAAKKFVLSFATNE